MGCQASKSAATPAKAPTQQSPTKTLLESAEVAKVGVDAVAPGSSVEGAALGPLASPNDEMHKTLHTSAEGEALSSSPAENPTNGAVAMGVQDAPCEHPLLMERTSCSGRHDLDLMVVAFSSHDSTVGNAIGRNHREMHWKVMYDHDADPIDIKLQVQEHKLHSQEVSIQSNGQYILHGAGSHAKAKLSEDFHYHWPLQAAIRGLNDVNFFEFSPPHLSKSRWFPATITCQRQDGLFDLRAQEPDASGHVVEMTYYAVHTDNLREAASQNPLSVPENCLKLEVPKQDALRASLCTANGESVMYRFGRPSPHLASKQQKPEVALQVSKDRSRVTANVGHAVLSHFASGEVRASKCDMDRLRHSWTVQIGPFAEHTIQIEKKYTLGRVVTLLVDGEVLVEANATDIGCEKEWNCTFQFVGERILDFEVFKTNKEGSALAETDHVKERRKYRHDCRIVIPNEWDFSTARFSVDGVPFTELPLKTQMHAEPNLEIEPRVLLHGYGIATPYKVDYNAPSNMAVFATHIFERTRHSSQVSGGLFACCAGGS